MAGSVRVGQAVDEAPPRRFHSRAVVFPERGFCADAYELLPGHYLAARFMDRIGHRSPQIIGFSGMGGAGALIDTTTFAVSGPLPVLGALLSLCIPAPAERRPDDISKKQCVVAGAERIAQTAETTASYSRT